MNINALMEQPIQKIVVRHWSETIQEKWRYRVGDYRVICKIEDDQWMILAIGVRHRREVYK